MNTFLDEQEERYLLFDDFWTLVFFFNFVIIDKNSTDKIKDYKTSHLEPSQMSKFSSCWNILISVFDLKYMYL